MLDSIGLTLLGFLTLVCPCILVPQHRTARFISIGLLGVLVAAAAAWEFTRFQLVTQPRVQLVRSVTSRGPKLTRPDAYVTSGKCQACHPGEYASWHRTYHRTMTQLALPENVLSDFRETTVNSRGLQYRVWREGDAFWAEMPDPDLMMLAVQGEKDISLDSIPRVKAQVVMATGSHHYQTFWVSSPKFKTVLQTLPLVYLPTEKQWIPRENAFLQPPDDERMITQWNTHCIKCHSTGGVPGVKGDLVVETEVGELGISCEACHGPAEKHVLANQSLKRRFEFHLSGDSDPTIVNPGKLDHVKSSEVCGQCHGIYIPASEKSAMEFAANGMAYRPGGDIHRERYFIHFPTPDSPPEELENFRINRQFFRNSWWDDGSILVGGREYTAMARLKCVTAGKMSCLSCHSMHHSDPNDQLQPGMATSQACVQCHKDDKYNSRLVEHTHHSATSTGSDCLNCHMPHTTYALFSGIRNHTISVPRAANSIDLNVPNACNLCHLDRTLEWSQQHLADWYGHDIRELTPEQKTTAAALLWLLKGNAAQRIIVAWHFGWDAAQAASGTEWMPPFLVTLFNDPYGAVRHVARNSLRTLTGYQDLSFDFLGEESHRMDVSRDVFEKWERSIRDDAKEFESDANLLMNPDRTLDRVRLQELLAERDETPVRIQE